MRKRRITRIIAILIVCLLLSCGLTAFAAEEGATVDSVQLTVDSYEDTTQLSTVNSQLSTELYPSDVQTVTDIGTRNIIKTYTLTAGDNPDGIPREDFIRDGWRYTLTDITQRKTSSTDTRTHIETVEINTDSNDMNTVLAQLSPTLEYESEDGYCGLISLDLASVKCEAAGYKNNNYTVSATREYPQLSSNDLSYIPKTVTENGRTLELDSVSWEAQHTTNIDFQDIPDSYRAVAKYTAKASSKVVTGYVTTARYSGEIAKAFIGDTIYTAVFIGTEINPTPKPTPTPEPQLTSPKPTPEPTTPTPAPDISTGSSPVPLLIFVALIAALLAGGIVFFFLRHNVKVYVIGDRGRLFVAKVRISVSNPTIDLTPLTGRMYSECFHLEIDRFVAKTLNGRMITVIFGASRLEHRIAYEGNTYRLEADFHSMTIKALY